MQGQEAVSWIPCSRCHCAPCNCGQSIGNYLTANTLYGTTAPALSYSVESVLREASDHVLASLHAKIPGELKRRVDDLRKRVAETQRAYESVAYPPPKGEP